MPMKDLLFAMSSHPAPTTAGAVEAAAGLASRLGAHLTGLTFELDIRSPVGLYADPLNMRAVLADQSRKSAENAQKLVAAFEEVAGRGGAPHAHLLEKCAPKDVADLLVVHARLFDLTIFPVDGSDETVTRAESLAFGAGRPVLLLPEKAERPLPKSINTVAIAWDHSRPAARAVADALPFVQSAKRVSVLTVIDEKRLARPHSGVELCKHLARHGVEVTFEAVEAGGRPIGDVLEAHAAERNTDLLVMGAYGHSKLREFILGGATRSVLARPFTWTLVSH